MTENHPAAGPLTPFLAPTGVAVIGASHDARKLGYGLARNLVLSSFPGAVHFVNPAGGVLFERPVWKSVTAVPDPVDLAVVLVPAPAVAGVLEDCAERGIRAVVVASGGFRETGPRGEALERRLLAIARRYDMRLLGPNCIGTIDTHLPVDTTFLPPPGPSQGAVAFVSHSGAVCAAVIDWARGQGFGLSRLVSLGNQVDVCETDVLGPVADDPHTRVVTLYLEGIRNGRGFVEEAAKVVEHVPVLALKVGRGEAGRRAVASHTGALAGSESAYDAAFRRAGVIRAQTAEELFDWARALAWCPLPNGRNVAILTNAGGPGVTAADAVEFEDLALARLSDDSRSRLAEFLPSAASLANPVDMLASASPDEYARSLEVLLSDPGVDSVMVVLPTPPMHTSAGVVNAMLPVILTSSKPVVVALMGEVLVHEASERLRAARVPDYRFPERAASALAALAKRSSQVGENVEPFPRPIPSATPPLGAAGEAGGVPAQEDLADILSAYGIPVARSELATTAGEAGAAAVRLGLPVVLKIEATGVTHKSDIGGVLTDLHTVEEVHAGYSDLLGRLRQARPDAELRGVRVQPMVDFEREVIAGAVTDDQFGPMIMFGSGGIEVEARADVAFALAPVTPKDVDHLLETTWAGRMLAGYRSVPPGDREAVVEVIRRLSWLVADHPEITEIEINPLLVGAGGEGAIAVDVRAVVSDTAR